MKNKNKSRKKNPCSKMLSELTTAAAESGDTMRDRSGVLHVRVVFLSAYRCP